MKEVGTAWAMPRTSRPQHNRHSVTLTTAKGATSAPVPDVVGTQMSRHLEPRAMASPTLWGGGDGNLKLNLKTDFKITDCKLNATLQRVQSFDPHFSAPQNKNLGDTRTTSLAKCPTSATSRPRTCAQRARASPETRMPPGSRGPSACGSGTRRSCRGAKAWPGAQADRALGVHREHGGEPVRQKANCRHHNIWTSTISYKGW